MASSASPLVRYQDVSEVKAGGATYTPQGLADFVAEQMLAVSGTPKDGPVRVLDPAIGHGELLVSLLSRLEGEVEVFGYETDAAALAVAEERLAGLFPNARLNLSLGSFLDHVLEDHSGDLFGRGERYDLIIANPPYVRTQIIGAEKAQLLADQFGLTGRVDLYFAFLLGMTTVLAEGGTAGIIVSNRFMTTKAGSAVREGLARKLDLQRIFDLGDTKLFDAAVLPAVIVANGPTGNSAPLEEPQFTSIYEAKGKEAKSTADDAIAALRSTGLVELPDGRIFDVQHGVLDLSGDASAVWRLSSADVSAWLAAVDAKAWARFRDIGKVRVGVKTTADKIFIRRKWDEELELLRPLTTHKIARRFRADTSRECAQILYPHEVVDGRRAPVNLDKFPLSRAYLEAHREKLESRTYVIESGRQWYEIWVPQSPSDWIGPKLVFRDISERPTFWIDLENTIVNGDCYWLKPKPGMEDALWLALAVANSTFIEQFYDKRFNNKLYAGRRRFITQYVDEFPIPDPKCAEGQELIRLAKMMYEQVDCEDASDIENALDDLVWKAFFGSAPH